MCYQFAAIILCPSSWYQNHDWPMDYNTQFKLQPQLSEHVEQWQNVPGWLRAVPHDSRQYIVTGTPWERLVCETTRTWLRNAVNIVCSLDVWLHNAVVIQPIIDLLTTEFSVAQWLEHLTRVLKVVGSILELRIFFCVLLSTHIISIIRLELSCGKWRCLPSNRRGAYETQKRNYSTRVQSTSPTTDVAEHADIHSCLER